MYLLSHIRLLWQCWHQCQYTVSTQVDLHTSYYFFSSKPVFFIKPKNTVVTLCYGYVGIGVIVHRQLGVHSISFMLLFRYILTFNTMIPNVKYSLKLILCDLATSFFKEGPKGDFFGCLYRVEGDNAGHLHSLLQPYLRNKKPYNNISWYVDALLKRCNTYGTKIDFTRSMLTSNPFWV